MTEVRLFTTTNGEILETLYAQCFQEPLDTAIRESLLASPGMWAAIAWSGAPAAGEALGFIIARSIAGEAEIISIGVRPDRRRRGVGAALLADALYRAVALGAQVVFLEVAEDNPGAIALYRRAEFEIVGRRPDYYRRKSRSPVAALIMRHTVKKSDS